MCWIGSLDPAESGGQFGAAAAGDACGCLAVGDGAHQGGKR